MAKLSHVQIPVATSGPAAPANRSILHWSQQASNKTKTRHLQPTRVYVLVGLKGQTLLYPPEHTRAAFGRRFGQRLLFHGYTIG